MMGFIHVLALTFTLLLSFHLSESGRNQYKAREDGSKPELLNEATDHPQVQMSQKADFIKNSTNNNKQLIASDLHVRSGDGLIREKRQQVSAIINTNNVVWKRSLKMRQRRSFASSSWWTPVIYEQPYYKSISVWQPPVYTLSRPYIIPVYGTDRYSIYFPPQPIRFNPGAPVDNPIRNRFRGPTYLPPRETTTPSSTTMKVDSRFDGGDDRPVWDMVNSNEEIPTTTPSNIIPTRATRPPGVPKVPPLIHNPTDPETSNEVAKEAAPEQATTSATTNQPGIVRPNELSRCVWAIISCCSSEQVNYSCFEQRGCIGAFWDRNPCDSDFAKAAISAALNYYNE